MKMSVAFTIRCAIASFGLFWMSTSAMPQDEIPLDTFIVLQSGKCEMGCPVYRIVIFADGDVLFQGRSRVRRTGAALTHIGPDQVQQILEKFKQTGYNHIDDIYGLHGSGCTKTLHDEPIVILSLSTGGVSKTLTHHRGCVSEVSKNLSLLEDSIVELSDTAQWAKAQWTK
jgi:hypothetical protein